MAYLHKNQDLFREIVEHTQSMTGLPLEIVEKDYYVTAILKELAARLPFVVFKGGTSLSKCYKAISRYSEDIDITIDTTLSQGQKRSVKSCLLEIAELLGLNIPNLSEIRSRRSLNRYEFHYQPLFWHEGAAISQMVLLETSYAEISFPVNVMDVHSMIGDMLADEAPQLLDEYQLHPFQMKVQSLERTLIDKVFAIGDYFLSGREIEKHSRHLYDIYKLLPLVMLNDAFRQLVIAVRQERAKNAICLSAQDDVDFQKLLKEIIASKIYQSGYDHLTIKLLGENVSYDEAITSLQSVVESKTFA